MNVAGGTCALARAVVVPQAQRIALARWCGLE